MIALSSRQQFSIGLTLTALTVITRYDHFGSPVTLPDATLAAFFLAGFYLRNALALPLLLLGAGLTDYLAINVGGVSDWCFSPAYWFLIPAYASLWFGGRWYAKRHSVSWPTLLPLIGTLFVTTGTAFAISNASFYLLSGYFPHLTWVEYGAAVVKYLPPYVGWVFFYTALVAIIHLTVTALRPLAPSRVQH